MTNRDGPAWIVVAVAIVVAFAVGLFVIFTADTWLHLAAACAWMVWWSWFASCAFPRDEYGASA